MKKWLTKIKKARITKGTELESQGNIHSLFEELEELAEKKYKLNRYYKELLKHEQQIGEYEKLQQEDIDKLSRLISEYKRIEEQRRFLQGRLVKNNRVLRLISEYEGDIVELIAQMTKAERKKKENEAHLIYLEEEKEELISDREILIRGYQFLKGFSIVLAIGLAIGILGMCAFLQTLRENVWIALSVTGCILVVFLAGIIFSKEYLEKALRDNEVLQQKAATYLNKIKIRCFHHTNYLQFQYSHFGVDSSAKLQMHYNRFLKSKDNEKDYVQLTRNLMALEEKINSIFRNEGIREVEDINNLQGWLEATKKVSKAKKVAEERMQVQKQLKSLEQYEEELWKEVFILRQNIEYETIIAKKMEDYVLLTKGYLDKEVKDA